MSGYTLILEMLRFWSLRTYRRGKADSSSHGTVKDNLSQYWYEQRFGEKHQFKTIFLINAWPKKTNRNEKYLDVDTTQCMKNDKNWCITRSVTTHRLILRLFINITYSKFPRFNLSHFLSHLFLDYDKTSMKIEICRISRYNLITSRKRHVRHFRQERMKNENSQYKRDINDFFQCISF